MSTERSFTYREQSNGAVAIFHGGTLATTLRGDEAKKFLKKAEDASSEAQQQLMARLTGNYKRGNERAARSHPRNR
jgi:hypothetical protein